MSRRGSILATRFNAATKEIGVAMLCQTFRIGKCAGDLIDAFFLSAPTAVVLMIVKEIR